MTILDKLLGRPLPLSATNKNKLSIITAVPSLGLDSFASIIFFEKR